MSRVFNEAGDAEDITKFGGSTELDCRPVKKPKTDPEAEAEAEAGADAMPKTDPEAEAEAQLEMREIRRGNWDDPEYVRQGKIYEEQFEKSEGYDVDWDSMDYCFAAMKFEWRKYYHDHLSNKEYMDLLIQAAIKEENEETGTKLEFVKYVSANVVAVAGFLFYITFWAQDLSSPNPEPKCYQAKVRKFAKLIDVIDFRLKPTQ